ncbi:unnamed protein product [Peronospora destructor]|uniref:Uncharacterized protein n=1 Tax=Peronospora destructor TaxID=86335 RepID=A0AAV0VD35_9STRA|nr:unnamed protein product [Peronospora destructor]
MERVLETLTRLETRMDTMERASVSVSNSSPVSPRMQHAQPGRRANGRNVAQAAFAGSEFRRAIDGGSALRAHANADRRAVRYGTVWSWEFLPARRSTGAG